MKYIFITGGVTSSLGKGIVSASLASLLIARGYKVRIKKMDPYLNIDPGTMNPIEHGEVFITDDGAETDLDLGHYERFTNVSCNKNDSISAGKIYLNVLERERKGEYLGQTIQVIPHVTNEIKKFIDNDITDEDFLICEIGGTVGDIEATPFLESIRQFINEKGSQNTLVLHLTLLPYLSSSKELKTKPTQYSVRELQSAGIKPNIILCRSSYKISDSEKQKISLFCNVDIEDVVAAYDVSNIYQIPMSYHRDNLDVRVLNYFKLDNKDVDLSRWQEIEKKILNPEDNVNIAIVGKYIKLQDAYKSISEALIHSGIYHSLKINIKWIDSEKLETDKVNFKDIFKDIHAIIIAPGFGSRGVEGKIATAKYIRENNIPFLGICYGMQMALIEYARNVLGIKDATSSEISSEGTHIVGLMHQWQKGTEIEKRTKDSDMGGTLRLGSYECHLKEGSLVAKIYGSNIIYERHRHRYEVNINYKEEFEKKGIKFSGISPDGLLPEIIEIPSHRWFIGVQFHPELKSTIFNPHKLFVSLIEASYQYKRELS